MRKPALTTLTAAAALTLAACESTSLAPEIRTAPVPAAAEAGAARYDALLRAMNSGREATPEQRRALHLLAGALGETTAAADGTAPAPALSPAAEAALRDFGASRSGAEMRRLLERLAAELAASPR